MEKNYGLDLEKEVADQRGDEWQYGAIDVQPLFTIPDERDRIALLPLGEVQKGREDMVDCATRGPINVLEAKFTYALKMGFFSQKNVQWLRDKGYVNDGRVTFSDAFIAIKSGTRRTGNSMKAPLQAIHECGLIPKPMLPLESWMKWEDYHDPKRITQPMTDLGLAFKQRFTINYTQVPNSEFKTVKDYVVVAGHAWDSAVNGVYQRSERQINHVFASVKPEYTIFDNYIDQDGDFLKLLAPNYLFRDYGYEVFVSAENPDADDNMVSMSFLTMLLNKLMELLGLLKRVPEPLPMPVVAVPAVTPPAPTPVPVPAPTNAAKIYANAISFLGKKIHSIAADEVACAESLSNVMRGVFSDFPIILATVALYKFLKKDARFRQTLDLDPGNILVAYTGDGNGTITGHTWIIGKDGKFMSNNSNTGLWEANYTLDKIVKRWRVQGGMHLYCFAAK